ncbi:hypothetical protein [Yoonia litorea]|uniref:Uncharacterized protein n=1 Tax=Yoonia litorea TaxID=1123755 RepID=A0A1I6MIV7_9RHOB|nr:hypothetical protein [Yoonia litorea]SFS15624.1 hypothetical protein SAMN05444714_1883 [Yoonia litorea]
MTALERYVRLESDALWRATPDDQRRDVVISFGKATLVIADQAGRPLAHWSLTALIRKNQGVQPALYVPDEDESELLEISDDTMVEAIEEVRKALSKSRPHPGKLRLWLTGLGITAAVLLATLWLPSALTRQTLAVVPPAKRSEIGMVMLDHMTQTTGPVCDDPRAKRASGRLAERLFGAETPVKIFVVPSLPARSLRLPGGIVVISSDMLRLIDDPASAAGFILAAWMDDEMDDPLEPILDETGVGSTLRLLTTGGIDDATLQAYALRLAQEEAQSPEPQVIATALATAGVPFGPYVNAIDKLTGSRPELGPDPLSGVGYTPILNDSDWVSLRNACDT